MVTITATPRLTSMNDTFRKPNSANIKEIERKGVKEHLRFSTQEKKLFWRTSLVSIGFSLIAFAIYGIAVYQHHTAPMPLTKFDQFCHYIVHIGDLVTFFGAGLLFSPGLMAWNLYQTKKKNNKK